MAMLPMSMAQHRRISRIENGAEIPGTWLNAFIHNGNYHFDETCQGSVSESIISFLESQDYESAIRNAISLGGDSDTMACIAGGIAQAFYRHIPSSIVEETKRRLTHELLEIVSDFESCFPSAKNY
jgi:ADP-ribosylglycohydrolase